MLPACLAFGPYKMQGVPSATNLTATTTGIMSIGSWGASSIKVYQVGGTHGSHPVLAISHYPHLVVHHHLDHSIMCHILANDIRCES